MYSKLYAAARLQRGPLATRRTGVLLDLGWMTMYSQIFTSADPGFIL